MSVTGGFIQIPNPDPDALITSITFDLAMPESAFITSRGTTVCSTKKLFDILVNAFGQKNVFDNGEALEEVSLDIGDFDGNKTFQFEFDENIDHRVFIGQLIEQGVIEHAFKERINFELNNKLKTKGSP